MAVAYLLRESEDELVPITITSEQDIAKELDCHGVSVAQPEIPVSVDQMLAFDHIVVFSDINASLKVKEPNLNVSPGEPNGKLYGDVVIAGVKYDNDRYSFVDLAKKEADILLQRMVNNKSRVMKWTQTKQLQAKVMDTGFDYSKDLIATAVKIDVDKEEHPKFRQVIEEMFTVMDKEDYLMLTEWFQAAKSDGHSIQNGLVLSPEYDKHTYKPSDLYPTIARTFESSPDGIPGKFIQDGFVVKEGQIVPEKFVYEIDAYKLAEKITDLYDIPVKTEVLEFGKPLPDKKIELLYSDIRDISKVYEKSESVELVDDLNLTSKRNLSQNKGR